MAGQDLTDLDAAFEVPDVITDPRMRQLYEVLIARMTAEAKGLPMNTVQLLLIERIATNYIVMRVKERGELGGFSTTNMQKDFNSFWLTMTAEFNRMLGKVEKLDAGEKRSVVREYQNLIVSTLSSVGDPRIRAELMEKFAVAFETVDI